jgi:hypothetical protein
VTVRDCQEYLSWLCAMMHEMHHSVLLAQWSAEVRHTLTVTLLNISGRNIVSHCSGVHHDSDFITLELYRQNHVARVLRFRYSINLRLSFRFFY